jgi:hypothetical protein
MVKVNPLVNPTTAQWAHPLTHSDYSKILKGFLPRDMDDKWMIVTDTPDADGNTVVHICRSWSSNEHYSLSIAAGSSNDIEAKDWATIAEISWSKESLGYLGEETTEEEAKESAIAFCKHFLDCTMEI